MPIIPFCFPYLRRMKHFVHQRTAHADASLPASSMPPGAIPKAYGFPANLGTPKVGVTKYGVVALGGTANQSDLNAFCDVKGWPHPKLTILAVDGQQITSDPGGANTETHLDCEKIIEAWNTAYPTIPCDVTVGVAINDGTGIARSAKALYAAGCTDVNCSWGAARSDWDASDITATDAVLQVAVAKGFTFSVASGDNSVNDGTNKPSVDFPCGSIYAWSVGGTALTLNADGSIKSEKGWGDGRPGDEGGGGGVETATPTPPYQIGTVSSHFRECPDSAADADPNTGHQVYSDGAWGVIGGTSASAPTTCGLFGVIRSMGGDFTNFQAKLYANRKNCFNDIILGSNGLPAKTGYDDVTGNGSPNAPGIVATLVPTGGTTPPITVTVPKIVGDAWLVGQMELAKVGLVIAPATVANSAEVITAQAPAAGVSTQPDSTVTVTLAGVVPPPPTQLTVTFDKIEKPGKHRFLEPGLGHADIEGGIPTPGTTYVLTPK